MLGELEFPQDSCHVRLHSVAGGKTENAERREREPDLEERTRSA